MLRRPDQPADDSPEAQRIRDELNAYLAEHPELVPDIKRLVMGDFPATQTTPPPNTIPHWLTRMPAGAILKDVTGRRFKVTIEPLD